MNPPVVGQENDDLDDAEWRAAAYEQFLRDDCPEDEVYDLLFRRDSHDVAAGE